MDPTLATLTAISLTIIAVILIVILVVSIPVLLQVRRTAREAEKLVDAVRMQVAPISRDIGLVSGEVRSIVQSIHRQVDRVQEGIETVHDMATHAKQFQNEIQQRIKQPLVQLEAIITTIRHGIEVMRGVFCR